MSEPLFLSTEEIQTLTGIAKGHAGRTREQLQCEWLRLNGIAHKVNARGAPVVYRSQFTGASPIKEEKPGWEPQVLKAA